VARVIGERVQALARRRVCDRRALAGLAADALGLPAAMWIVAALTFASGLVVAIRMSETLQRGHADALRAHTSTGA
jgi:hypothetical protein